MTDDRRVDRSARSAIAEEQTLANHLRALAGTDRPDALAACPGADNLAAYATLSDTKDSHRELRAHLTFCDHCCRELLAIEAATASSPGLVAAAVDGAVEIARRLRDLVRFEMPTYQPLGATRGGTITDHDPAVVAAMAAYADRRYADAGHQLEPIAKAGAFADADVYLAACQLHDGRPEAAAAVLDRVLKRRPNARTALWLRAQCDLALGVADTRTRKLLRGLANSDGPYQDEAAALLARLAEVTEEA